MRENNLQISKNELMRIIQETVPGKQITMAHVIARLYLAENWLRLAGCKTIFHISSYTGEGIVNLFNHLKEDVDIIPWEN